MIGPKLEARDYAIFVLVVIGALLSLNAFAQRDTAPRGDASTAAIREVASATREVANANQAIARSNSEIAEAVRQLARAVAGLDMNVMVPAGDAGATRGNQGQNSAADTPAPARTPSGVLQFD